MTIEQDIPYNGYPKDLSYGGAPAAPEHTVYDVMFPDKPAPRPTLLAACVDASRNNMPEIRHGRVCYRDQSGMVHISGLAR